MKGLLISIVLILTTSPSFCQEGFYDLGTVRDINIIFTESNWDQILDTYYSNNSSERLIATVVIDGVSYDSCGVRYKGNNSYSPTQIKNSFNIKMDYEDGGQDANGYETLNLSNIWRDPSQVREVLAYEIARKYTTAPQANYANVSVNGVLIGLYMNIEPITKDFIRSHYYETEGTFAEGRAKNGAAAAGCPIGLGIWADLNADTSCYDKYFGLESDYGYQEISEFLDTFNNHGGSMEEVLNVDRHIWTIGFNNTFANLDAPINIERNYYLYKDINRQFNHIMWDQNFCFGSYQSGIGTPTTLLGMQQLSPYYHDLSIWQIVQNILAIATYKNMYFAHMRTILQENISNNLYVDRIDTIQAMIDAHVQADTNKFFTYQNFLDGKDLTVSTYYGIRQLMDARNTYLMGLPELIATPPTITTITNTPTSVPRNSTATITATVSNATYVYIGTRNSIARRFLKTEMFDDGAHGDGAAGDRVYGANILVKSADVQYYIYAENTNAGIFSPERAEYEFHRLGIQKGVVINEVMAINTNTAYDQGGEFDDYIELYNTTNTAVSLDKHYLTDNIHNHAKWEFPLGTTIPGNGYLIVWADEDGAQNGIHCSFKLSGSGEKVLLVDSTLNIIDEVAFGPQTANSSYSRSPNGTGPFILKYATYNHNNDWGIAVDQLEDEKNPHYVLYPNPAKDWFTIKADNSVSILDFLTVEVYNALGQLIHTDIVQDSKTISTNNWGKGLYIVRMSSGQSFKLIKQ
jgi:hypothetical protein